MKPTPLKDLIQNKKYIVVFYPGDENPMYQIRRLKKIIPVSEMGEHRVFLETAEGFDDLAIWYNYNFFENTPENLIWLLLEKAKFYPNTEHIMEKK